MRKKIDYYGFIRLEAVAFSPICVAGGEEKESHHDVMRDFDGEFFIPGTSLAGAFRSYCEEMLQQVSKQEKLKANYEDVACLFGYVQGDEAEKSSLFISDGQIQNAQLIVRDGITLSEDKIILKTKKYDYEALDAGTELIIEMEVRAQAEEKEKFLDLLKNITVGVHEGRIRLGYKKMRGMGELRISQVLLCEFERGIKSGCGWQNFSWKETLKNKISPTKDVTQEWLKQRWLDQKIRFSIPLELQGGISIRKYSARRRAKDVREMEVDFEQLSRRRMDGEKEKLYAIIPGTTWNGALRHQCKKILQELGIASVLAARWIQSVFGDVDEKVKEAFRSKVEVKESELSEDSVPLIMMRNRINRFDAATMEGALYTEISYFGGTTALELSLPDKEEYYWAAGLLILVLKDIANGFQAIGGQTAIGRGIFYGTVEIEKEQQYLQKLAEKIGGVV